MNSILVLCLVALSASIANAKEKKISLLDIERDYLNSEKSSKYTSGLEPQKPITTPPPIKATVPSPTKFGFLPVKGLDSYVQSQPKPQYVQPYYVRKNQPYSLPQNYPTLPPASSQKEVGGSRPSTYTQSYSQNYQAYQAGDQYQKYENVPYVTSNSIQHYPQYSSQSQQTPQHATEGQQYSSQGQQYEHQFVPQHYSQLPQYTQQQQQQQQQQYYIPQYYYVQQQSSSDQVQAVIDPKGGLQLIMYVPTYVPQQTQNYQNVVYADIPSSEQQVVPVSENQSPADTAQYSTTPDNEYVNIQPKVKYTTATVASPAPAPASAHSFIRNREPKSLLDSYVPSYLQIQYIKQQQQAQANALAQVTKLTQTVPGKVSYVKTSNYKPQQNAESKYSFTYQYPSTGAYIPSH